MKKCTEDPCMPQYLTICESELRGIAAISAMWGEHEIETGGEMFGLWTHGGRPVIFLITAPGPKATHKPAYFEQDVGFFHRTHEIITEKYGIQLLGTKHCHHFMGITEPSNGDASQVQGLTSKNNFTRWCEIITTCEKSDDISRSGTHHMPETLNSNDALHVTISAYLYTDPQRGEKIKVPIRVLPGISPVRLRALADGSLDPTDIGEYGIGFPMERIRYDRFDFEEPSSVEADELLQTLAEQCQELPSAVQGGISFDIDDNFVTVTLPLPDNIDASINYSDKSPHNIQTVYISNEADKKQVDVTAKILAAGSDIRLNHIYEILTSEKQDQAHGRFGWNSVRGCIEFLTGPDRVTKNGFSSQINKVRRNKRCGT